MRRIIAIAVVAICWSSAAVAGGWQGWPNNIAPLAFGMSADAAGTALGAPLVYVRGRPGHEIFIADRGTGVISIYPIHERYSLQFRRGKLTGWKRQWQVQRPFFF